MTTATGGGGSADQSKLTEFFRQVDWKATLEGTEAAANVPNDIISMAERIAGVQAFRGKYYKLLFDEVIDGVRGRTGIVVSKQWRIYYDALQKIGKPLGDLAAALNLVELGEKLSEMDWSDHSVVGYGGNVIAGWGQWATESTLLGPVKTMQTVSGLVGVGAGRLGYEETARDFQQFSCNLEGTILSAQAAIDRTLSVANARDVLTWDRSVYNPLNWQPVAEEAYFGLRDLGTRTVHLFDAAVEARVSAGASGGW